MDDTVDNQLFSTLKGVYLKYIKHNLLNKIPKTKIKENIHAVLHFAGLKAVGESVRFPIEYWANNLGGTINLLLVMQI